MTSSRPRQPRGSTSRESVPSRPGASWYHPKVGDTMYHARGYVSQKNGPGGDAAKKIYDCDAVVAKHGDVQVLAWATDRG